MVSYGGLITAGIIGLTYLLLKKENINSWFNLLMPSGLVALAIGRIGCFLNGDDCGLPTKGNPWWSITFSNHQEPIARLPLQILESSLVFLVVVILYKFQEKNFKFVGVFGLALYLSLRFWLSSYRFS